MKMNKSLVKNLLVLFLCLGFLTPIRTNSKQPASPNHSSATTYSDLPSGPAEK